MIRLSCQECLEVEDEKCGLIDFVGCEVGCVLSS